MILPPLLLKPLRVLTSQPVISSCARNKPQSTPTHNELHAKGGLFAHGLNRGRERNPREHRPREASPLLHDQELGQHGEDDHAQEHGVLEALDNVPAVGDGPRVELVEDLATKT